MPELPGDWGALCALVFLLGMRHGFDPDHLAAIDGLTRLSSRLQRAYARACGALFSLGHGAVVLAIAAAVGTASRNWAPPAWLGDFGAWVSIAFLLLIGTVNLRAVLSAAPGCVVPLVGIKGPLLGRWLAAESAWGVAAVGALFALSFDTVSQAALFAVTAARYGGVGHAIALGLLFVLGMVVADGINGWWVARLIARADAAAARASRVMSLAITAVSLAVAAVGIGRLLSPAVERWAAGRELAFAGVLLAVVGGSFGVARLLARRPLARQPARQPARQTARLPAR